jgi:hypothetical protein
VLVADDLYDGEKREQNARFSIRIKNWAFLFKTTHGYTHAKMEKATRDYSDRKKGKKPIAHLPELCPDLVTALAGLYVDDFTA